MERTRPNRDDGLSVFVFRISSQLFIEWQICAWTAGPSIIICSKYSILQSICLPKSQKLVTNWLASQCSKNKYSQYQSVVSVSVSVVKKSGIQENVLKIRRIQEDCFKIRRFRKFRRSGRPVILQSISNHFRCPKVNVSEMCVDETFSKKRLRTHTH